jgi:hypothetical protein
MVKAGILACECFRFISVEVGESMESSLGSPPHRVSRNRPKETFEKVKCILKISANGPIPVVLKADPCRLTVKIAWLITKKFLLDH